MSDLVIEIRVRPNASRNKFGSTAGDPPRLVVAVQAPAVDAKANAAVIKELAETFSARVWDMTIVHGQMARDKRETLHHPNSDQMMLYDRLFARQK